MNKTLRIGFILVLLAIGQTARAQGGIGNMPRSDIVMLSAVVRDSIADEAYARILDLKRYADSSQFDSAALMIAYNGVSGRRDTADGRWARALNPQNPDEKSRASLMMTKVHQLFATSPEVHKEYFAVFKDKDNPAGEKLLYQINFQTGSKKHMVSFVFYPIGDKIMLGDVQ